MQKMEFAQKNFHEIDLFDFTRFLEWTFLNFLAHCELSEQLILKYVIIGGLCALGGIFILTLPIPIVVNSFASYYKNRLWRNEVAYKKRQRAKKRREMELLMRDNLLNILTVPGTYNISLFLPG